MRADPFISTGEVSIITRRVFIRGVFGLGAVDVVLDRRSMGPDVSRSLAKLY